MFTIIQTPDKLLAWNNCIYVSATTQTYAKIKNMIFTAEPHADVDDGYIGLNLVQRESLKLSIGDKTDVVFYEDIDVPDILVATVQVSSISKIRKHVDEQELYIEKLSPN